jgi:formamidase
MRHVKTIAIDRSKHLTEQPGTGHNRWHPDIRPIVEVDEGEEVALETRDGCDGYLGPGTTVSAFSNFPAGAVHPLTGPVLVKGARPGDLLEVEFVDIVAQPHGFSCILPGLGFLRDVMTTPFLAHWTISGDWATSPAIPGVRIPAAPFMGVSGVAPSRAQVESWTRRESELLARGGLVFPPDADHSVPASGIPASHGLRTLPPRENGGNFDVKQLTKGSKLLLPVAVDGALFSTGDGHFAQGDGEVCVTAVEMGATCVVRFRLHRSLAERHNIRWPRFEHAGYFTDPRWAAPRRFVATMGMPVDDSGTNKGEDLNLACRNALLNMIQLLGERGFNREQAYVICSVGVDLRISNVVDVPNYVVSALLPLDIFEG